jgi:3'(2'), 5'-bisphosphate nucleotidase
MSASLTQDLDHARLLEALTPAVLQAGQLIERLKAAGIAGRAKADRTPVTEADEAAETLLAAAIREAEPDAIIVGEEACAAGDEPDPTARFWLIDPLDGTRDFVEGRADYSVNVGLVVEGRPVLGLVLHPPSTTLWTGAEGLGAWKDAGGIRTAIRARPIATPPVIVTSRSHLDDRTRAWAAAVPNAELRPSGSSLKLCLLADGTADLYPRFGPTCEWDTGAADAILRAAGGTTLGLDQHPLAYGKPSYRNTSFLALADPTAAQGLPRFED